MVKKTYIFFVFIFLGLSDLIYSQSAPEDRIVASPEEVRYYTYKWDGERFPDGRPKVDDDYLERLKDIKVEDVWQLLNELGYQHQFEGGWKMLHEDQPMTGRALTAVYRPSRPDVEERLIQDGLENGHIGPMNSWPIDKLQLGDIYVADAYGKIEKGILIGDKLGNSIFGRSENGVLFDGAIRDIERLVDIEGFNAVVRGWDPQYPEGMMLTGINVPTRIGQVTVFPGDVILSKKIGTVVIPPHLVEEVVITSEIVTLMDEFVHERVRARVYTPGQVDDRWTQEIQEDFLEWVQQPDRIERMPVPPEEMQDFLQHRTW
jgi:4-hydroxy-4-methyl-2-oxoglutarate aldolase